MPPEVKMCKFPLPWRFQMPSRELFGSCLRVRLGIEVIGFLVHLIPSSPKERNERGGGKTRGSIFTKRAV